VSLWRVDVRRADGTVKSFETIDLGHSFRHPDIRAVWWPSPDVAGVQNGVIFYQGFATGTRLEARPLS
jgi:hypothetical protein